MASQQPTQLTMSLDIRLTDEEEKFLHIMARKIYPTAWGDSSFYTENQQTTAVGHVRAAFLEAIKGSNVKITRKRKTKPCRPSMKPSKETA